MARSFEDWVNGLGRITKYAGIYVLATTAGVSMGFLPPQYLAFTTQGKYGVVELLWRPITSALFFGTFSINWLMTMPVFITYLSRNELGSFPTRPVDFLWMLCFLIYTLGTFALALGMPWTSFSFLLALCWVHCRRNPTERASIFGFEFQSTYYPWVLVAVNFMLNQSLLPELVGIFVGHMYVFFQDIYPATHGKRFLDTPRWFVRVLARIGMFNEANRGSAQQSPATRQQPDEAVRGHTWGQGRTLGAQ